MSHRKPAIGLMTNETILLNDAMNRGASHPEGEDILTTVEAMKAPEGILKVVQVGVTRKTNHFQEGGMVEKSNTLLTVRENLSSDQMILPHGKVGPDGRLMVGHNVAAISTKVTGESDVATIESATKKTLEGGHRKTGEMEEAATLKNVVNALTTINVIHMVGGKKERRGKVWSIMMR